MEFTKTQVAALVLGYLKREQLCTVVTEFLKTCPYLEENRKGLRYGKYVVTRVAGFSLIDFLEQYALIYNMVHGRLEETGYDTNTCVNSANLVEKIVFLLDKELPTCVNFTPETNESIDRVDIISEVETTPLGTLPGNVSHEEKESSPTRTPQRNNTSRCRSRDREIVTPAIQSEQLAQKIAENINLVRGTPEVAKPVPEENISAGASKELDAVIKNVLQRTEGDPVYNNLIEEIVGSIGTVAVEDQAEVNTTSCNETSPSSSLEPKDNPPPPDPIEDHNNDAIRSIIEASSQNPPPEDTVPPPNPETNSAPVYVYDGNLESFLKTSGATAALNPNPLYLTPPPLVLLPPADAAPSNKLFIVNNQPLINMNMKSAMLTENQIMSIPTIVINDDAPPTVPKKTRRNRQIKPKKETGLLMTTTQPVKKTQTPPPPPPPPIPAPAKATPSSVTRQLDFSTPGSKKAWDEDLRILVGGTKDKSPSPKKKRPLTTGTKKRGKKQIEIKEEEIKEVVVEKEETKEVVVEKEAKEVVEEKEGQVLQTPVKDSMPKTPGANFHCTPFTEVLEAQLVGVDLSTIPTPSIPITPGFALTPGDLMPGRSTDYSTSSSYYQPSDTEQNRSIDQLIEECKRLENASPPPDKVSSTEKGVGNVSPPLDLSDKNLPPPDNTEKKSPPPGNDERKSPPPGNDDKKSPPPGNDDKKSPPPGNVKKKSPPPDNAAKKSPPGDRFRNLKILSDVVLERAKVPITDPKRNCSDHLKKFNKSVIGKKNLNLLKRQPTTSSSSSTDSDSDSESNKKNNTVICKIDTSKTINDIINKVKVKNTLDKETKTKNLLSQLEEVRQRTIRKIKNPEQKPKKAPAPRKAPQPKKTKPTRKTTKKKEEKVDKEAQKLVKGLAQRGIHLIPNKKPPPTPPPNDGFDKKTYDDFEIVIHDPKRKSRELSSYDLTVLSKSMSIRPFDEDRKEEVTRVIKWTNQYVLLDLKPKKGKKNENEVEDELMDGVFARDEQTAKGGKKRKLKCNEEDSKQVDKKSKTFENDIKLLKKIDVDSFLDKVHGE